jgi:hypothetical protein
MLCRYARHHILQWIRPTIYQSRHRQCKFIFLFLFLYYCYPYHYYNLYRLVDEFKRGKMITSKLVHGSSKDVWNKLMEHSDFFFRYKNYLNVVAMADSDEDVHAWYVCVLCNNNNNIAICNVKCYVILFTHL